MNMEHNQNQNDPYFVKTAVAYGDSITHGVFTATGDTPNTIVEKSGVMLLQSGLVLLL
jgi:hypothetical protein